MFFDTLLLAALRILSSTPCGAADAHAREVTTTTTKVVPNAGSLVIHKSGVSGKVRRKCVHVHYLHVLFLLTFLFSAVAVVMVAAEASSPPLTTAFYYDHCPNGTITQDLTISAAHGGGRLEHAIGPGCVINATITLDNAVARHPWANTANFSATDAAAVVLKLVVNGARFVPPSAGIVFVVVEGAGVGFELSVIVSKNYFTGASSPGVTTSTLYGNAYSTYVSLARAPYAWRQLKIAHNIFDYAANVSVDVPAIAIGIGFTSRFTYLYNQSTIPANISAYAAPTIPDELLIDNNTVTGRGFIYCVFQSPPIVMPPSSGVNYTTLNVSTTTTTVETVAGNNYYYLRPIAVRVSDNTMKGTAAGWSHMSRFFVQSQYQSFNWNAFFASGIVGGVLPHSLLVLRNRLTDGPSLSFKTFVIGYIGYHLTIEGNSVVDPAVPLRSGHITMEYFFQGTAQRASTFCFIRGNTLVNSDTIGMELYIMFYAFDTVLEISDNIFANASRFSLGLELIQDHTPVAATDLAHTQPGGSGDVVSPVYDSRPRNGLTILGTILVRNNTFIHPIVSNSRQVSFELNVYDSRSYPSRNRDPFALHFEGNHLTLNTTANISSSSSSSSALLRSLFHVYYVDGPMCVVLHGNTVADSRDSNNNGAVFCPDQLTKKGSHEESFAASPYCYSIGSEYANSIPYFEHCYETQTPSHSPTAVATESLVSTSQTLVGTDATPSNTPSLISSATSTRRDSNSFAKSPSDSIPTSRSQSNTPSTDTATAPFNASLTTVSTPSKSTPQDPTHTHSPAYSPPIPTPTSTTTTTTPTPATTATPTSSSGASSLPSSSTPPPIASPPPSPRTNATPPNTTTSGNITTGTDSAAQQGTRGDALGATPPTRESFLPVLMLVAAALVLCLWLLQCVWVLLIDSKPPSFWFPPVPLPPPTAGLFSLQLLALGLLWSGQSRSSHPPQPSQWRLHLYVLVAPLEVPAGGGMGRFAGSAILLIGIGGLYGIVWIAVRRWLSRRRVSSEPTAPAPSRTAIVPAALLRFPSAFPLGLFSLLLPGLVLEACRVLYGVDADDASSNYGGNGGKRVGGALVLVACLALAAVCFVVLPSIALRSRQTPRVHINNNNNTKKNDRAAECEITFAAVSAQAPVISVGSSNPLRLHTDLPAESTPPPTNENIVPSHLDHHPTESDAPTESLDIATDPAATSTATIPTDHNTDSVATEGSVRRLLGWWLAPRIPPVDASKVSNGSIRSICTPSDDHPCNNSRIFHIFACWVEATLAAATRQLSPFNQQQQQQVWRQPWLASLIASHGVIATTIVAAISAAFLPPPPGSSPGPSSYSSSASPTDAGLVAAIGVVCLVHALLLVILRPFLTHAQNLLIPMASATAGIAILMQRAVVGQWPSASGSSDSGSGSGGILPQEAINPAVEAFATVSAVAAVAAAGASLLTSTMWSRTSGGGSGERT